MARIPLSHFGGGWLHSVEGPDYGDDGPPGGADAATYSRAIRRVNAWAAAMDLPAEALRDLQRAVVDGMHVGVLGHYVYTLRDPADTVFYVGMGSGERVLAHVREARSGVGSNGVKLARIMDIGPGRVRERLEVYGISSHAAAWIERYLIQWHLARGTPLTNKEGPLQPRRYTRHQEAIMRALHHAGRRGLPRTVVLGRSGQSMNVLRGLIRRGDVIVQRGLFDWQEERYIAVEPVALAAD